MRNAKIQTKLIAGFMVAVLFSGIIGFVGIAALTTSAENNDLLNERITMAIMSTRLERIVYQQRSVYRGATVYHTFGMMNRFELSVAELEALDLDYSLLYNDLSKMLMTDKGKQIIEKSHFSYLDYSDKRHKLLDLVQSPGADTEEIAQMMELLTVSVNTLVAINASLTDFINDLTDEQALQGATATARATTLMVVVIFAALIISLSFSLYISRIVVRPLSLMKRVLMQICDVGNLNFPKEQIAQLKKEGAYRDEIGQSISAFNRMTDRLLYLENRLGLIADGHMDVAITPLSPQDTIGHALKRMIDNLNSMFNDMRNVETDLRLARNVAEESTKVKSEFLANMSHEIRTPMNGVLGLLHLTAKTALTEKQQEYIDKAKVSAQNLLRIINDILDFSKIEAGKMEMEFVEFNLKEIFEEINVMFSSKLSELPLTLTLTLPPHVPHVLVGDPLRLKQILINLISNSIKFTHYGEINVHVQYVESSHDSGDDCDRDHDHDSDPMHIHECVHKYEHDADHNYEHDADYNLGLDADNNPGHNTNFEAAHNHICLHFSIQDTGIGMTCEQANRLFNPFTQADTSITRKYGGTGLGLAICKNIVDMMNGKIWVSSKIGEGSTFHFTACFASAASVPSSMPGTDLDPGADLPGIAAQNSSNDHLQLLEGNSAPANSCILLVEDNEINQIITQELLTADGYSVDIAENGQIAIDMIHKKDFSLVLMDIQMPVMDGITATKKIRADAAFDHLPIIAMSAHAMASDVQKSLDSGMNAHLTKPIDPGILHSSLVKWVPVITS